MCLACGKTGDVRKLCNLMEPCDISRRGFLGDTSEWDWRLKIQCLCWILFIENFPLLPPHPPSPSTLLYLDGWPKYPHNTLHVPPAKCVEVKVANRRHYALILWLFSSFCFCHHFIFLCLFAAVRLELHLYVIFSLPVTEMWQLTYKWQYFCPGSRCLNSSACLYKWNEKVFSLESIESLGRKTQFHWLICLWWVVLGYRCVATDLQAGISSSNIWPWRNIRH